FTVRLHTYAGESTPAPVTVWNRLVIVAQLQVSAHSVLGFAGCSYTTDPRGRAMHKLADLSLANRALVALVTIFVLVFGVVTTAGLKQELIPSLQIPTAMVISTYEGASPDVVEE